MKGLVGAKPIGKEGSLAFTRAYCCRSCQGRVSKSQSYTACFPSFFTMMLNVGQHLLQKELGQHLISHPAGTTSRKASAFRSPSLVGLPLAGEGKVVEEAGDGGGRVE